MKQGRLTYHSLIWRIIILVALLSLFLFGYSEAQFSSMNQSKIGPRLPIPKPLAEFVKKQMLMPAIEQLRLHFARDNEMLSLLEKTKIVIEERLTLSPEAYAERKRIVIDMMLIPVEGGSFDVGAFILTGASDPSVGYVPDLADFLGQLFGRECADAAKKGMEAPRIKLYQEDLNLSQEYVKGLKEFSADIMIHYMTWVLLHEMGHHKLKHTESEPPESDFDSREDEQKADNWAFRKMNELDYSLPLLLSYFYAKTMEEQVHLALGLVKPENQSTHPSWNTRRVNLEKFMKNNKPPVSNYIFLCKGGMARDIRTNKPIGFTTFRFLFPNDPNATGVSMGLIDVNGKISLASVEYIKGVAYLYQRDPFSSAWNQIRIENPWGYESAIEWRFSTNNEPKIFINRLKADRLSFTNILNEKVKGTDILIRVIDAANPLDIQIKALQKVESRPNVRTKVEKIIRASFQEQARLTIDFQKRLIEANEFEKGWKALADRTTDSLKKVLGEKNFQKFQKEVLENPIIKLGLSMFSKRLPVENLNRLGYRP